MEIRHLDLGKTYRVEGTVKNLLGRKVDVGRSWIRLTKEMYNGGLDYAIIIEMFGDYSRSPLPWKSTDDAFKWLSNFLKDCTICIDEEKAESRVRSLLAEAFREALDEGFTPEHVQKIFEEYPKKCLAAEGGF